MNKNDSCSVCCLDNSCTTECRAFKIGLEQIFSLKAEDFGQGGDIFPQAPL